MRRSKRRRNSELDKDEEKLQIALQDIQKKMKSVIPLKKKVNESLSTLQELVDKNKLSIGCKLNGALRGRVLNLYENGYCQRSNRCADDYITLSTALSIIVLLEIGASECAVVFATF
uniref:Bm8135 n=1 Tax=Brugia malayi TaxID=6279 RepID=A0A1I9GEW1_BRUMA|nr:Bm8135 [Brugia malayi]